MRAPTHRSLAMLAVAGAALLAALTACAPVADAPSSARTKTAPVTSAPSTTEAPSCSGLTGVEALAAWAGEVETSRPWDLTGETSDVTGYDECAEVSWIALRPRPDACCTVFEITPVMFFHRGVFVPGATVADRALDRATAPERLSTDRIALTFATPGGAGRPPVLTRTEYAWDDTAGTVVADEPQTPAAGGDVNGRWCPTPESTNSSGCVTVTLPNAVYDNGTTLELVARGDQQGDGGTAYMGPGAPFGTFYPAGIAITVPDYYPGPDLPDQDRIWNGQTGVMMVRE